MLREQGGKYDFSLTSSLGENPGRGAAGHRGCVSVVKTRPHLHRRPWESITVRTVASASLVCDGCEACSPRFTEPAWPGLSHGTTAVCAFSKGIHLAKCVEMLLDAGPNFRPRGPAERVLLRVPGPLLHISAFRMSLLPDFHPVGLFLPVLGPNVPFVERLPCPLI